MTLDPDARTVLLLAEQAGGKPFDQGTPDEARAAYNAAFPLLQAPREDVASTTDRVIDGPGGPLPLRVIRGCNAPPGAARGLLYLHGGGWVIGNLESHDDICRSLANEADAVVVCPDYRLAPEHKFPAAVEDCFAALRFMHDEADSLGIDPARIAVAGDSAGGNLAAVLALAGRDGPVPAPQAQLLFYPVTDARQDQESYWRYGEDYGLTTADMAWFRHHYIRNEADIADWRVSPLLAPSVAGASPAFVALAGYDVLVDEGAAYAARLAAEGVPTISICWDGQIHGFVSMGRHIAAAREAIHAAVDSWRQFEARSTGGRDVGSPLFPQGRA